MTTDTVVSEIPSAVAAVERNVLLWLVDRKTYDLIPLGQTDGSRIIGPDDVEFLWTRDVPERWDVAEIEWTSPFAGRRRRPLDRAFKSQPGDTLVVSVKVHFHRKDRKR